MTLRTIAFSGHRPQDLGGFDERNPLNVWVKQALAKCITQCMEKFGTKEWISGGALGVDQWAAEIVLWLKNDGHEVKLIIMKPFRSQHIKWNEQSQERFLRICDNADEIIECSVDPYAPWKMQFRNKEMCKKSDMSIVVWNGNDHGGTSNYVKNAIRSKKPILRINPIDRDIFWEVPILQ